MYAARAEASDGGGGLGDVHWVQRLAAMRDEQAGHCRRASRDAFVVAAAVESRVCGGVTRRCQGFPFTPSGGWTPAEGSTFTGDKSQ